MGTASGAVVVEAGAPPGGPENLDNAAEWDRYAAVERTRRVGGAIGGAVALATGLLLLTLYPLWSGPRTILDDVILVFLLGLGALFLLSAAIPSRRGRWVANVDVDDTLLRVRLYSGAAREVRWSEPEWEVSVAHTVRPKDASRARLEAGGRLSVLGDPPILSEPVTREIGEAIVRRARTLGLAVRVEPDEGGSLDLPKVYERVNRIRPRGDAPSGPAPSIPTAVVAPAASVRRAPPVV